MLASETAQHPAELLYDRRQSPRVALEAPALVDAFHAWRKCSLRSLSATGISVETDLDLAIGSRADVYFEVPRVVAVEVHAEVVRRTDRELVFRFLELPREAAEAIALYVRSHPGDELPATAAIC